jgi:hypothetical protein
MMRAFLIWIAVFLALTLSYSILTHNYLSANPRNIVIAVDTSFEMKKDEAAVDAIIRNIIKIPYSVFTLITDKSKLLSGVNGSVFSADLKYYGSLNVDDLIDPQRYPELNKAEKVFVIIESGKRSAVLKKIPRAQIIELK